jgi:hypothetical protein
MDLPVRIHCELRQGQDDRGYKFNVCIDVSQLLREALKLTCPIHGHRSASLNARKPEWATVLWLSGRRSTNGHALKAEGHPRRC